MKNAIVSLQKAVAILWLGSVYSCSSLAYAPTAHNVPLLREKKEVRVNALLTTTEYLSGPEIQASYAATNHLGILGNFSYLSSTAKEYGYLFEGGAGYYKAFPKELNLEIYGGVGSAKVVNQERYNPYTLYFTKAFVQPAIGCRSRPNLGWPFSKTAKWDIELALSPKVSYVYFREPLVETEYILDANGNLAGTIFKEKQGFWAFEPALTTRFGWKHVLFQVQIGVSLHDIPFAEKLNLNGGLCFNLAPRLKSPPVQP